MYLHYLTYVALLTDTEAGHILLVDNLKIGVEDSLGGSARHYRRLQGTKTSWPPDMKMEMVSVCKYDQSRIQKQRRRRRGKGVVEKEM